MTRPVIRLTVVILASICLFLTLQPAKARQDWVEVRSANFIVVSNAGERAAKQTAIHLEQIRAIFRKSLKVAGMHATPVITVFALKDENSMKAFLPEFWAKGHAHVSGLFLGNRDLPFAVVSVSADDPNIYKTVFHEYYHSLVNPYYPNLPVWLSEGLAEFYGHTDIDGNEVQIGQPDENLVEEIHESNFIPMGVLFNVDRKSPYYNEENKTSVFYAECWAITHYLMVGDKGAHRAMLAAYLDALSQGSSPEEAGVKAFGDLKRFQETVDAYVRNHDFPTLKMMVPEESAKGDLHVRNLSDAEIEAYHGGFDAARGRTKEALPMLQDAVKLDPKLELGYEYLGYAQLGADQKQEAMASLSRAIELNPNNARARYFRAYLYSSAKEPDYAKSEADLRAAIAQDPDFAGDYGDLAQDLVASKGNMDEALAAAKKAITLEPGNAEYQLDLAKVLLAKNRNYDARLLGLSARSHTTNPELIKEIDAFLASVAAAAQTAQPSSDGAQHDPKPAQ